MNILDLNSTPKSFKLAQASDETLTKSFEAALKPVEDDDKRNHYVMTGDLLYRTSNRSDGEEWMQFNSISIQFKSRNFYFATTQQL